jgi:cell division septum initiation protein DivIVA
MSTYFQALDALEQIVTEARGVPLSASAVIPREEALNLIKQIRDAMPAEHQQAQEVMNERERILTDAHEKSAFIVEQAREERSRLLARAEVVIAAEKEAQRIVLEARAEAEKLAHDADDYADAKLADVEIVINKLLRTISRGREQLRRRLEQHAGTIEPLQLDDSGEISQEFQPYNQDEQR